MKYRQWRRGPERTAERAALEAAGIPPLPALVQIGRAHV